MLITLTAVFAVVFALRVASHCPTPLLSNDGIALLWSLLTRPELDILFQSTTPIILSLIVTNIGIKGPRVIALSKSSQDTSPSPLLNLMGGPYFKSLDLFKPIVSLADRFNTAHSLDALDHAAGVLPNAWNRPSPTVLPTESLETTGLHYVGAGVQQDESSNAPAAGFTRDISLDVSTTSTSAATILNNSSVNPIRPFTLSSLTIAATCVFLAVSTTLAILMALSVIIVNWAENETAIPFSPLAVHQLPNSDTITTPKLDALPSIKLRISRSGSDAMRSVAPLYHVSAPADSNIPPEIPFGDLQKPTNCIQDVISADGSIDVPVSVSVNTRQLADFNHGVTMSQPSTSKPTFTESDRQMNFSPSPPHEPSVPDSILATPTPSLYTRTTPPGRLCRWQQTPTPMHTAEASSGTVEPKISDCGNASPPSPQLEQSVADSIWANVPMPPPNPRTRRTSQQQPLSVCQRQHTPTSTPFEAYCNDLPPSPLASDPGQREQSFVDSMWANAPIPPSSPRTRTAPTKRPSLVFQQERTTPIEPSGCAARTEMIDCGNLPSPPPDLEHEQSVADSMWANAPMPPSPNRAASCRHQRSQNSGAFHRNTAKWASSAVYMVERRTASAARNE